MAELEYSRFPRKNWDLDFRAELYKEEFYQTDAWAHRRDQLVAAWDTSTTQELAILRELKERDRPSHLSRIIQEQQTAVIISYWYDLLRIDPIRWPLTVELLHATIHLAGSAATYCKASFNRVRPWVLAPDLAPPMRILPGHPAYPGGHSTQVHAMALVLTHLAPKEKARIRDVARAVAVNRERAGLNYPSDTAAGERLAAEIFQILVGTCTRFQTTLAGAEATEWASAASPSEPLGKGGLPA